jgi:ABC-type bacteriocin/lantibiotic exporter with double-glycine peptidase domain
MVATYQPLTLAMQPCLTWLPTTICVHTQQYASVKTTTGVSKEEIQKTCIREQQTEASGDQLIKREERETGDTGLKPYIQYLSHRKGFLFCFLTVCLHFLFVVGQLIQNYFLAADIQNPYVSKVELFTIYSVIGFILAVLLLFRSFCLVRLGCDAAESISSTLVNSLFRAPMSFYDSTPLGRILSRVRISKLRC